MTITKDMTAYNFLMNEAWEVDEDLAHEIGVNGLVDDFERLAMDVFPSGVCTETAFNDWLRFDVDDIRKSLGLAVEDEDEDE